MPNMRDKILKLVGRKISIRRDGESRLITRAVEIGYDKITEVGDDYFDCEHVFKGKVEGISTFSINSISSIGGKAEDYERI